MCIPVSADDYVRVVGMVGKQYQIHWLYTPDSYDTLLSTGELRGAEVDKLPLAPPYHVSSRWVEDTPTFNEWMNEKDYEVISKDGQLVSTAPYLGGWTELLVLCCSICFVGLVPLFLLLLLLLLLLCMYVCGVTVYSSPMTLLGLCCWPKFLQLVFVCLRVTVHLSLAH